MKTEPVRTRKRSRRGQRGSRSPTAEATKPFDRIGCPILRAAARRVVAGWRANGGEGSEDDLPIEGLTVLACTIDSVRLQPESEIELPPGFFQRRLLDFLRAEVVSDWLGNGARSDPSVLLDLVLAFERVREALEPDRSLGLSARLSGPDGLELVMEVAHDLRSPLTSILTLADALRRGQSGEVNELQRRQLGLVYSAALGLSSVASDMIELAHGGDHLADNEPLPFSVGEILESVRDIVQPMAEEKGLSVRILPPEPDHRLGFPLALSRVLLNLTTNALKFTNSGFVEIVTRARGPEIVEFSVRDSGDGIAPEAMKSLYQPFRPSRVRGKKFCFSGTGLGLSISRKLVQAMGSTLCVETRPGWGTRFYFLLTLPPATAS